MTELALKLYTTRYVCETLMPPMQQESKMALTLDHWPVEQCRDHLLIDVIQCAKFEVH